MSSSKLESPAATAVGLPLSDYECLMLLDADVDIIDFNPDLLRSLPCGKLDPSSCEGLEGYDVQDNSLLYPPSPPECKPFGAPFASELQLDSCKQESFPTWLEEKVDLHMLGLAATPAPAPAPVHLPAPPPPPRADDTAELLREFETVYGAVELTHLTPPQSPPGPATQLLLSYAQAQQQAPWPQQLDREMALVDELVRAKSALLPPPAAPASPLYSSASPLYSSASPSSASSSSADEDWERPARAKPYARPGDDRRSRKKEQNKNAATRYRQKKKAEVEVLLSEESVLRQRRGELDSKCSDLQREIRYLKGLMRDLFKAKGLIK